MIKVYFRRQKRGLGRPETVKLVRRAVKETLKAENILVSCEVDVLLTDDDFIRRINREQRDMDMPTDVLSFPMNELRPGEFDEDICERDPETGAVILGDMVISIPRCEKQGEEYGNGYEREVSYLAVHSTLHLLGYDHMDEGKDKKLMRSREKEIVARLWD